MIKKILCAVSVFMLVGTLSVSAMDISEKNTKQNVLYDESTWISDVGIEYPVRPDCEEWKTYATHEEMVAACNIPENLLQELSTVNLVELMLDYPLLGDLLLFDDINVGIMTLAKNSNILTEIIQREDGAYELLKAYSDLDIMNSSITDNVLRAYSNDSEDLQFLLKNENTKNGIEMDMQNIIKNIFLEGILASEEMVAKLTTEELSILANEAEEKVLEKENSDIFSAYTYAIYDVAIKENTIESLADVEKLSYDTTFSDKMRDTIATVKTPKGSSITVIKRTYSASEALSAQKYTVDNFPNAVIVRNATTNYNCHSYAWYSQSSSNPYWMNNPAEYMFDGSYTKVGTTPTATNQKVCYTQYPLNNPYVHSGIVYSISGSTIKLTSKWGAGPLVIHNVTYSPYNGTPIYYK